MADGGLSQDLHNPIVEMLFVMATGFLFSRFILQSSMLRDRTQGQWDDSRASLGQGEILMSHHKAVPRGIGRRWGFLLAVLSSVALAEGGKPAPPKLAVEMNKPEDTFFVRRSAERTVYVIKCPSGIGGAKITKKEGDWPRNVILRFQYDDERPYHRFESFGIRTDRMEISTSITLKLEKGAQTPVPVKFPYRLVDAKGTSKPADKGGIPASGVLEGTVQLKASGLEISLPPECLVDSKTLNVGWIDAFRT